MVQTKLHLREQKRSEEGKGKCHLNLTIIRMKAV